MIVSEQDRENPGQNLNGIESHRRFVEKET